LTQLQPLFDADPAEPAELAAQVVHAVAPAALKLPAGQIVSVKTKDETDCAETDPGVTVGHLYPAVQILQLR
jgi:hypothetical protein